MWPSRRMLAVRLCFWVGENRIRRWADGSRVFFILGMGRSGTRFLSELLNRAPNAAVFHEPVPEDYRACAAAFRDPATASRYIRGFRRREIFLRGRRHGAPVYGEVNSLLRRHLQPLRESFPQASFIHLVRDGRDVVRSTMARNTMRELDPHTAGVAPAVDDPWHSAWPSMDRFARLCWYWQHEVATLQQQISNTIKLEKILSDWPWVHERLLEPLGIELTRTRWQEAVRRPANPTTRHCLPHWSEWSSARQETFEQLCGTLMSSLGYDLKRPGRAPDIESS